MARTYYKIIPLVFSLLFSLQSCHTPPSEATPESTKNKYARGFSIEKQEGFTRIDIRHPQDSTRVMATYLLVPASDTLPARLPAGSVVRTPLTRIVPTSSVHCALLTALGVGHTIVGVCEPQYLSDTTLTRKVASGSIRDMGSVAAPAVEEFFALTPQAVFITPIDAAMPATWHKVPTQAITLLDYMETSPLGRSEWLRMLAPFFGKEAMADSLFNEIERRYMAIKQQVPTHEKRPSVLCETKTGNVWYQPAGGSYMARLIADAGGRCLWDETTESGSLALSPEQVMERGINAEVWILKYYGTPMTYSSVAEDYAGCRSFASWRNQQIFGCNTAQNQYYEEMVVRPYLLLGDMAKLLHPKYFSDDYRFFTPLAP